MKALCNREGLLAAFGAVSGVVPARSPKPILQNVKLVAHPDDGSTLLGTDLEVGIRHRVLGVKVDRPGAAILPTQKLQSILRSCPDEELMLAVEGGTLLVRGLHAQYKLPSEDPDLFPDVPDFAAAAYHAVGSADLKRLIRRTAFATDPQATRYALGGVLFELADESVTGVATDGRRLAKMAIPAEAEGGAKAPADAAVLPTKALKLIERVLEDDDPPVHLAVKNKASAAVRTERSVIWTRLVEGRFPRYQDVFPPDLDVRVPVEAGPLLSVVNQASIVTSEESRGVDFAFRRGVLQLTATAADVGSSDVDLPIAHEGRDVAICFDPRYLADALKVLDPAASLTVELRDHKAAAVFRTADGYAYVIMPLTRER